MAYKITVDTGGTFTDVVVGDEDGRLVISKAPTQERGFAGLRGGLEVAAGELGTTVEALLADTSVLTYATTRSTNAVLERGGVDRDNRVRLVLCSGIVPGLHAELERRWGAPWREVFGMTETGVDLVVRAHESDSVGTGSVGRPVATKEARIVDAGGRKVGQGGPGELCVRGPLMTGYWNRREVTAETLRDGWLHTGDLGCVDQAGGVRLVGRLKDMVRRGGENIACAEVEAVLAQHDAVVAAAIVPVADELWGEEPKAYVQLAPGQSADAETAEAIVAHVGERLASFKAPRYVQFVDDFPRTPSERIAKPQLAAVRGVGPVYEPATGAPLVSRTSSRARGTVAPTEPREG